jgi:MinD-like ATPase involved in chromosome partitioning or flagellar assembly
VILTLTSVKGAPGTTTTALALAENWPGQVLLVEADVTAGSPILAGRLLAERAHDVGLLNLVIALRKHGTITAQTLLDQTIQLNDHARLLPGLTDPVQAPTATPLWPRLADVLTSLPASGIDVIVDFGRASTALAPDALLAVSDTVAIVTRCTLPDLIAVAKRAPVIAAALPRARDGQLAVIAVDPSKPYTAQEIRADLELPVLASIPWDPKAAAAYSHGADRARRHNRSRLVRAVRDTAAALHRPPGSTRPSSAAPTTRKDRG